MTKNVDGGSICSRIERLIHEYEQTRESDPTEIGRQFAVSDFSGLFALDEIWFFQQLQRTMIENKEHCPSIEGGKPCNRQKNRYKDVLPCK